MQNYENNVENDDVIEYAGILAKGFGIAPKEFITDHSIPPKPKLLMLYLCSYAGKGRSAFPGRKKICDDLDIDKDTFTDYKRLLEGIGVLTVKQQNYGGYGIGYDHNVYTINFDSYLMSRLTNSPASENSQQLDIALIMASHFVLIPKLVMQDTNLTPTAKLIYAYIAAFTSDEAPASPKKKDMRYHLRISESTYQRHTQILKERGYIEIKRIYENGRVKGNQYLLLNPQTEPDSPSSDSPDDLLCQNSDTQTDLLCQNSDTQTELLCQNSDTQTELLCQNSDTQTELLCQNSDTQTELLCQSSNTQTNLLNQKQDTQNSDTNNTSIKYIYPEDNLSINQDSSTYRDCPDDDGSMDTVPTATKEYTSLEDYYCDNSEKIEEALNRTGQIPYEWLCDEMKLESAIRVLTDWDRRLEYDEGSGNPMAEDRAKALRTFAASLTDLLKASDKYHKPLNQQISYAKVHEAMKAWYDREESWDDDSFSSTSVNLRINELFNEIWSRYAEAIPRVKNPFKYMQSCIWSALRNGRRPENKWRQNT